MFPSWGRNGGRYGGRLLIELWPESEAVSSSWGTARTPLLALVPTREGEEDEEEVDRDLDVILE